MTEIYGGFARRPSRLKVLTEMFLRSPRLEVVSACTGIMNSDNFKFTIMIWKKKVFYLLSLETFKHVKIA